MRTKLVILILIISFVFQSRIAFAIPTEDFTNLPPNILDTVLEGSTATTTGKIFFETVFGKMLKKIGAQVALNMTQQVINWGSTGFEGNPFFIRDRESFFKSVADEQVELFVYELTADTENPYARNIARNLASSHLISQGGTLKEKINFTLDEVVGPNWQDFTEGDFYTGGWEAWNAYTQNDANNPVGSYFASYEQLEAKKNASTQNLEQELGLNQGFLSMKQCVEYSDGTDVGPGIDYDTDWYFDAVYDNFQAYTVGPFLTKSECVAQYNETPNTTSECYSSGSGGDQSIQEYLNNLSLSLGSDIEFNESDNCERYETVTPGSLIKAQVEEVTVSPLKKAASESTGSGIWDAVSNLAAGLISAGVTELVGDITTNDSGATYEGPGDNSEFVSNEGGFNWNTGNTIPLEGDAPGTPSPELQKAIDDTQAELDYLTQSKAILASFAHKTQQLDQCLPGPDYKFVSRMQKQFPLEAKKLEAKADNDTENAEEAQDQLKCLNGFMSQMIADIRLALISGAPPEEPATIFSSDMTCTPVGGTLPNPFPIKNIPSAPLIFDQVNRIQNYNQDLGSLQNKIADKVRVLALLKSIKANIETHSKPEDYPIVPDSEANIALKNNLAEQYASIEAKIGQPATINEAKSEYEGYLSDDTMAFSIVNPDSLLTKCLSETSATDTFTKDLVARDKAELLFCSWQEAVQSPFTSNLAYIPGGYTQDKGYNDTDFKMDCSSFYRGSIGDYMPEIF